jgi:hypothetical protein
VNTKLLSLILCLHSLLLGCASASVDDVDRPLSQIKRAIEIVFARGIRRISPNGRELESDYAPLPKKNSHRTYHLARILGDRRPYRIEIENIVEANQGRGYVIVDHDEEVALKMRKKLQRFLDQSPQDRDLIDDFRAF